MQKRKIKFNIIITICIKVDLTGKPRKIYRPFSVSCIIIHWKISTISIFPLQKLQYSKLHVTKCPIKSFLNLWKVFLMAAQLLNCAALRCLWRDDFVCLRKTICCFSIA